ncbi:4-amino-4-deoxy-L-arabinose transferase-like glycosyltransferase [Clostridium acetobutylicum]|uniref:Uncharacterized conserved membrane protein, affecting LPS biosynthesis n=1 Tax=Clostridium acetobutylicum (strain ATCC 824 / DSM 792 / JCM 1419 / IAM 19013 / LMG 5710 / NBRC 13948 / NRRL B-527 / VKM B-1787 / 2291 / W) TaxID=272562 RepID=Q97MK3_CLOAB|nr:MULTISPECIES: glycosyltransferase family 39 protein [Clostridium]AAK78175.1 Uncharacterized conserved membrane protein, affecting LPS biosynthesis [Clostridium acetobutylicum ATCC 824]ADZ19239.1 Conserved hypothetical protein [Clostridium acetobutylicum EA 2018]AEI33687.1 hypothetical protein SMB_G0198 [Clostridium acetobutylicum DSM 1731]AWV81982.1 glycosyltransferase family 39 protein [Clostridium acetobutylicum]MBC2395949.1 glycosyltransferase family 39 protein [Clostridium acetobutylicu
MKDKIELRTDKLLLSLILVLSAILNFANIGIEGYANTFYAAGVKSMMMNFKNFFFASYDPSGFVTIDKPPVGFWIQTIFAKVFGFKGWSIILPQAIAGVLSVLIIYYLVKRSFGKPAGLIAALCLAITPIFVAASRNNTIDNLLVLSLVLSAWALSIAAENGKLKYLLISLAVVGIGFNIKMVEAYMVAPAIYITYLLSSTLPFKKRIKHLALGTIILLLVSLSWAVVTDFVPAKNRPYIGSSNNNTVLQLIIGHNGLQRIGVNINNASNHGSKRSLNRNNPPIKSFKNKSFMSRLSKNNAQISQPGILKLFSGNNMSDQISWLLPFALIGFVIASVKENFKFPFNNKRKLALLFWFTWLLPEFIYFSFSRNVTHTYYLTTMAPSIAALTGIGLVTMLKLFKDLPRWKWILPVAFIVNALTEIIILGYKFNSSTGYKIVILMILLLGILPMVILVLIMISQGKNNMILNRNLIYTGFAGLLIAPVIWSATPIFHKMNGSSPSAGLELFNSNSRNYANISSANISRLINFLNTNRKNEKYLVEVPSATIYGSDLILKTGKPILTLGGFSGSDPILTLKKFKQLVKNGSLRYAMITTNKGKATGFANLGGSSNSNTAIMNWIRKHGKLVPNKEWMTSSKSSKKNNSLGIRTSSTSVRLYDLKSKNRIYK